MLRPENVLLKKLFKMLTMRFVNVRSLKFNNLLNVDDEGLVALCKVAMRTILDVTRNIGFYFGSHMPRNITDMVMHSLASLSALKELYLEIRGNITNMGTKGLAPLTSLTKFSFRFCDYISDEGTEHWGSLISLRDLSLFCCNKFTNVLGCNT